MVTKVSIGDVYNNLTVISRDTQKRNRIEVRWNCVCKCGNVTSVPSVKLTSGRIKSCGCKRFKHSQSYNRIYSIWRSMLSRCYREKDHAYHSYGGRGIYVCDEWKDFNVFYKDLGDAPPKPYSLDRIDNNEGYSPVNCKWSTHVEQNRNTRSSVWYEINGENKLFIEWCEIYGIKYQTVSSRMRRGWTLEKSLTTPLIYSTKGVKKHGRKV